MKARIALVTSALVGSVMLTAAPANADTPGCVSPTEYSRVSRGMSVARVHGIFDTSGYVLDSYDSPGTWETDWTSYETAWDEWYYSEPTWDDYGYEWDEWWYSEPQVEEFEYWVPGGRDVVRSYKKCRSFDGGYGRVGINFDNYSSSGSGLRMFKKVRSNPWSLVGIYW